jgi:hypothetical protein
VPGRVWNRSPHTVQRTKFQVAAHTMHRYVEASSSIGWRVLHCGHVTSAIA